MAASRAQRLVDTGVRRVVDLACGIGADAHAYLLAGLEVVAVESDPATAVLARANLERSARPGGPGVDVRTGTAEDLAPGLLTDPAAAAFCDPARRDERGRVWRVEQFSPGWAFVLELLDGCRVGCVKLGPALPHALIPDGVEAEWVSHPGDVVECTLWAGRSAVPGARVATLLSSALLPSGQQPTGARLSRVGPAPVVGTGPIGAYLHEPDGAAIRAWSERWRS